MKKKLISIFIFTLLVLASGCVQQETQDIALNYEEIAGAVISEKLIVFLGYFAEFPENSALWQPKVEGLNLQYLAKLVEVRNLERPAR